MRIALALALLLAAPAAAHADIFGVADGHTPFTSTGVDIFMFNASTGTRVSLPSTINTAADETHPSISGDGSKLVFERDAGAVRIVLASLPSGTLTDLFNGIEQSANPQSAPAISADGKLVLTGEPFQHVQVGTVSALTLTDISTTPFTRTQYTPQYAYGSGPQSGQSADPAISGNLLAWTSTQTDRSAGAILAKRDGAAALPLLNSPTAISHPTLGTVDGTGIMLFDKRPAGGKGDILFRFTDPVSTRSEPETIALPPIVNSPLDESHPAITPDGRYIGFIRLDADGFHSRAFVWDTETQTLIDDEGLDLGQIHLTDRGNLSLFSRPLIKFTRVSGSGFVTFLALSDTGVGILVQRIVGKHKQFGKTVPTLKPVGRVPLGVFRKGRGHAHWTGRVGGKRLKPGRYQVTVRAVNGKHVVTDLGDPQTFTVR
jgi:WD40-like Beta Propeller Repeat